MPTAMLKPAYTINDRKKNNELVSMIKGGLSDLKMKLKGLLNMRLKLKDHMK